MFRPLTFLLLLAVLITACNDDKLADPCEGISCEGDTLHLAFAMIRLMDPANKQDLVYGPDATISPDSVKYKGPGDATFIPIEQRPGWTPERQIIELPLQEPVYLYIGKPGKDTIIKVTYQFTKTCCSPLLSQVILNDKTVIKLGASTYVYRIPLDF
ncbi:MULTISPECIES: hypothetical protein [unclassified Chitinophaga]|uniref:hypothetical protein n=1 Tax=unclassified Chitinophaga TaxID=2619133 RepID=UPI0030105067